MLFFCCISNAQKPIFNKKTYSIKILKSIHEKPENFVFYSVNDSSVSVLTKSDFILLKQGLIVSPRIFHVDSINTIGIKRRSGFVKPILISAFVGGTIASLLGLIAVNENEPFARDAFPYVVASGIFIGPAIGSIGFLMTEYYPIHQNRSNFKKFYNRFKKEVC